MKPPKLNVPKIPKGPENASLVAKLQFPIIMAGFFTGLYMIAKYVRNSQLQKVDEDKRAKQSRAWSGDHR